jgi:hypothetical protein
MRVFLRPARRLGLVLAKQAAQSASFSGQNQATSKAAATKVGAGNRCNGRVEEEIPDTPSHLGKRSGEALTVLDGCEGEGSRGKSGTGYDGTRQGKHG